jgi:hypothetical protein
VELCSAPAAARAPMRWGRVSLRARVPRRRTGCAALRRRRRRRAHDSGVRAAATATAHMADRVCCGDGDARKTLRVAETAAAHTDPSVVATTGRADQQAGPGGTSGGTSTRADGRARQKRQEGGYTA